MNVLSNLADELQLAIGAVRAAGDAVLRLFGHDHPVSYKAPDQPVTEADLVADRMLRERLVGERPAYGWLSEETADSPDRLARERVWIVDPIDGTRTFVEGISEFAVCVALAVEGEAVLGVVFNPASGELYHAVRGGGAFRNHEPIRVRTEREGLPRLLASRSEIRRGTFDAWREHWHLVPLGSTAYKLAKVADGTGDAYLSRGPKSEWDLCAAQLLVVEAGGRVTDLAGAVPRFNRPAPFVRGTVAASDPLHEQLLQTLASVPATHGPTGGPR